MRVSLLLCALVLPGCAAFNQHQPTYDDLAGDGVIRGISQADIGRGQEYYLCDRCPSRTDKNVLVLPSIPTSRPARPVASTPPVVAVQAAPDPVVTPQTSSITKKNPITKKKGAKKKLKKHKHIRRVKKDCA